MKWHHPSQLTEGGSGVPCGPCYVHSVYHWRPFALYHELTSAGRAPLEVRLVSFPGALQGKAGGLNGS